jgi:hypothetical protein
MIMSGRVRNGALFAAAALALGAAMPAQATMGCWNETQLAAAKVRDLQSRLMVASLRCAAFGVDITPAYNRFVVANRDTIQGANRVLMAQFRAGYGSEAQTHYDRFATALANAYGADATDRSVCAETALVAEEAAAANGAIDALVALEDRFGFAASSLPGGRCGVTFASAGTD